MPPFGPNEYCFITSLYLTVSLMSILAGYGTSKTAGSRFITYGRFLFMCKVALNRCIHVVLPDPAMPRTMTQVGGFRFSGSASLAVALLISGAFSAPWSVFIASVAHSGAASAIVS